MQGATKISDVNQVWSHFMHYTHNEEPSKFGDLVHIFEDIGLIFFNHKLGSLKIAQQLQGMKNIDYFNFYKFICSYQPFSWLN